MPIYKHASLNWDQRLELQKWADSQNPRPSLKVASDWITQQWKVVIPHYSISRYYAADMGLSICVNLAGIEKQFNNRLLPVLCRRMQRCLSKCSLSICVNLAGIEKQFNNRLLPVLCRRMQRCLSKCSLSICVNLAGIEKQFNNRLLPVLCRRMQRCLSKCNLSICVNLAGIEKQLNNRLMPILRRHMQHCLSILILSICVNLAGIEKQLNNRLMHIPCRLILKICVNLASIEKQLNNCLMPILCRHMQHCPSKPVLSICVNLASIENVTRTFAHSFGLGLPRLSRAWHQPYEGPAAAGRETQPHFDQTLATGIAYPSPSRHRQANEPTIELPTTLISITRQSPVIAEAIPANQARSRATG
ncbi:hypothetical protein B0H65DRAFT_542614 [Neurospora tetraspora]|uniref:Uncharacterized protein n=1 Tax=Neurospora tetraspora TaxID=94610 RepID=A0AAE0J8K9_9PEZI|nr:hypothetical protein B0H65DRAFT_542614 [Neurospora tetraspora]